MQLEKVIPWGRAFAEYCKMFNLREHELKLNILGCADGPASFNAELSARGGTVISADPVYQFSRQQIAQRVEEVYPIVLDEVRKNKEDFIWETFADENALGQVRIFPLVDLNANPSPYLSGVINAMENYGIACQLEPVAYRFQKNATHMLVLKSTA